ncbi:MAG: hypothetical protein WAM73_05010 [Desulfobacterales bacterium]
MVTTYEEDENGDSNRREAPVTTAALNVYLVMGAFMAKDKPEGQVHGMALIVEKRNNNVTQRSEPSLKRWVLLDENGDGRLDKALFRKNPHHKRDTAARGQEALAVPSEKLPDLQAYFDKAVRDLSKKALNGSGEACLFV